MHEDYRMICYRCFSKGSIKKEVSGKYQCYCCWTVYDKILFDSLLYWYGTSIRVKLSRRFSKRHRRRYKVDKNLYREYLRSLAWAWRRDICLREMDYECQECLVSSDEYGVKLHIHHLHYDNIYAERWEDLTVLCSDCHKGEHGIREAV